MESIPQGAFILEYVGEVIPKKLADTRGSYYDSHGISYLFDMNEATVKEELSLQKEYPDLGEFFPLCVDAMFYGNESRFINHSCDPNTQPFNISGESSSDAVNRIGLFAWKNI